MAHQEIYDDLHLLHKIVAIFVIAMPKKQPIVQVETEDGQRAGEAMVEAVENQMRDDDPPEVNQAMSRLLTLGETRENAMRYIATVFSVEVYETMKNHTLFDVSRYVKNLNALPKLPYDEEG